MTDVAIKRILRVNHAGEYGAIRIYQAQISVAKLFHKEIVPFLTKMRDDEINHLTAFRNAMPERQTRPCHTLWLWSGGGYLLGLITALMGRNFIMVCTEAVEDAVHRHMNEQITFLKDRDKRLKEIIETIKVEELEHLHYAEKLVKHNALTRLTGHVITVATNVMIWLSTQGASQLMKRDLRTL